MMDSSRGRATTAPAAAPGRAACSIPGTILHEMRLFKGAEEVAALERAIAIAAEAHTAAMRDDPSRRCSSTRSRR